MSMVVNFRFVVGGNLSLCGVCLDLLKVVIVGGLVDGDNVLGGLNCG